MTVINLGTVRIEARDTIIVLGVIEDGPANLHTHDHTTTLQRPDEASPPPHPP